MAERKHMPELYVTVLVDPFAQTVTQHRLQDADMDPFLDLYVATDREWNVLAEPTDTLPGIQFVLDDWAVKKPGQRYFRVEGYPHALGGRVLFLGFKAGGKTVSLPEGFNEALQSRIKWCPPTMRFVRFEDEAVQVPDRRSPTGFAMSFTRKVIYEGEE